MRKIILLLLAAVTMLAMLTSCTSKVSIEKDAIVVLAYEHDGQSVLSTLAENDAALVINNLDGLEITNEAPEGAEYVIGVYFMVGDEFYHVDLNGSSVLRVGQNEEYVELEHFRFHALMSLFEQNGVHLHSHE